MDLPVLPKNAKYVYHANECYDWGTFGWLLESGHVDIKKYKYFFFMNCSVRGPFLPAYARVRPAQPARQLSFSSVALLPTRRAGAVTGAGALDAAVHLTAE